jgi:hypothetical protein
MRRARRPLLLLRGVLALPLAVLPPHRPQPEADTGPAPLTLLAAQVADRLGVARGWAGEVLARQSFRRAELLFRQVRRQMAADLRALEAGEAGREGLLWAAAHFQARLKALRASEPLRAGTLWDSAADSPRWQRLCPVPPHRRPRG